MFTEVKLLATALCETPRFFQASNPGTGVAVLDFSVVVTETLSTSHKNCSQERRTKSIININIGVMTATIRSALGEAFLDHVGAILLSSFLGTILIDSPIFHGACAAFASTGVWFDSTLNQGHSQNIW